MSGFVHDLLDGAASRVPDHIAVLTDNQAITYRELRDQSLRLAGYLHSKGGRRGDRIAILLPNCIPTVVAIMAASRLGMLYVVINWGMRPYYIDYILADSTPYVLLTSRSRVQQTSQITPAGHILTVEDDWARALEAPPYIGQPGHITQDLTSLIYTSGSTGKPKAVMSTHRNVRFATWAIQQCLKMEPTDIIGLFLPFSFDYGLYQIFLTFQVGATLALGSELDRGPLLVHKLNAWHVTGLPLVPVLAEALLLLCQRTATELPKLRYITNTGMHLPPVHREKLGRLFPSSQIFIMFGLTECKRVSILDPADLSNKPNSVGRPLPDTECLIVDQNGQIVPPGTIGELVVRGPHVMAGYWNAPEVTEKRYRHFGDGLEIALFTGDLCALDEDGFLYFYGRQDDVYKRKGYRVSALELETTAYDIEGIQQAASVFYADEQEAILYYKGGIEPQQVLFQLRERLEDAKVPDRVIQVEWFPLTENGKIDKQQLRATVDHKA